MAYYCYEMGKASSDCRKRTSLSFEVKNGGKPIIFYIKQESKKGGTARVPRKTSSTRKITAGKDIFIYSRVSMV